MVSPQVYPEGYYVLKYVEYTDGKVPIAKNPDTIVETIT